MDTETFITKHLGASNDEVGVITQHIIESFEEHENIEVSASSIDNLWRYLKSNIYLSPVSHRMVSDSSVSDNVKRRVCYSVLSRNQNLSRGQQPGANFLRLARWLSQDGSIDRDIYRGIRKSLIWAPSDNQRYMEETKDILEVCKSISRKTFTSEKEVQEFLLLVISARGIVSHQGRQVVEGIMKSDEISNESKVEIAKSAAYKTEPFSKDYDHPHRLEPSEEDVLRIRFTPGEIRRAAVNWLPRLGEPKEPILRKLLKPSVVKGSGGDFVAAGALDIIDDFWEELEHPEKENILKSTIDLPDTSLRKRSYLIGNKYIGTEFLEKSLDDKAKGIRDWGEYKLNKLT